MNHYSRKTRLVALLTALLMVFQMLPVSVMADWEPGASGSVPPAQYFYVRFYDEGTQLAMQLVQSGATIDVFPQSPYKVGYVFAGWEADGVPFTSSTAVTGDVDVNSTYVPATVYEITINYVLKGDHSDHVAPSKTMSFIATDDPVTVTSPSAINRGGSEGTLYPLLGFVTITPSELPGWTSYEINVEYTGETANYKVVHRTTGGGAGTAYTVTIDEENFVGANGGTVAGVEKKFDHYTFVSSEGIITLDKNKTNIVYLNYDRDVYTIDYFMNGGDYIAPNAGYYGETKDIRPSGTPTREGYAFKGWYTDAALTKAVSASVKVENDITLYAAWEPNTVKYKVQYMKEIVGNSGNYEYIPDYDRLLDAKVDSEVSGKNAPAISGFENYDYYIPDPEKSAASKAIVAADGSTIVNCYYTLKTFRIQFVPDSKKYHYKDKNGNTKTGDIPSTDKMTVTVKDGKSTYFDAKIGDNIADKWLTAGDLIVTSKNDDYAFECWESITYSSKRLVLESGMVGDLSQYGPDHPKQYLAYYNKELPYYVELHYLFQNPNNLNEYIEDDAYYQEMFSISSGWGAKAIEGFVNNEALNTVDNETKVISGKKTVQSQILCDGVFLT